MCVFIATFEKGTKISDLPFNLSLKGKKILSHMKQHADHPRSFMQPLSTSTTGNAKLCLLKQQSVQL